MNWRIYQGTTPPPEADVIDRWLDDPPPWRRPQAALDGARPAPPLDVPSQLRAERYVVTGGDDELETINVALLLRRPLLVRGVPGIGKSSLAYSLAAALNLGAVLRWEIGSRSTLQDGLYDYDAVGHLRASQKGDPSPAEFITLGPLGTALLPGNHPRVLLIDELDKSAYDLPNDLLHVFEEGSFRIRELANRPGVSSVLPHDYRNGDDRVDIRDATVRVGHHPVVIITTNDEREFPDAFRRRCVELELKLPGDDEMAALVAGWFRDAPEPERARAAELARGNNAPPDQVLQRVFAKLHGLDPARALGRRG